MQSETMSVMSFEDVMTGRVGDYTVLYQYFVFLILLVFYIYDRHES